MKWEGGGGEGEGVKNAFVLFSGQMLFIKVKTFMRPWIVCNCDYTSCSSYPTPTPPTNLSSSTSEEDEAATPLYIQSAPCNSQLGPAKHTLVTT